MDEITIGEIGRSLVRLEVSQREQTEKLDDIKEQTTKTNGRVDRLEDRSVAHARELGKLNSAVFPRSTPPSLPAPDGVGESFGVRISPGMWKALYGLGGALATLLLPKLAEWLGKLGGS